LTEARARRSCSIISIAGTSSPTAGAGTPTTYHYHVLFREFLLEEAKKRLSPPSGAWPRRTRPSS
jgi:hypothetical protein